MVTRTVVSTFSSKREGVSSWFASPVPPHHQQPDNSQVLRFTAQFRGHQPNAKDLRALEDVRALLRTQESRRSYTARLPGHIALGQVLARLFRKTLTECPRLCSMLLLAGFGHSQRRGVSQHVD